MTKKSLVDAAKTGTKKRTSFVDKFGEKQMIALALAWMTGDVGISGVNRVLYGKDNGMTAYVQIAKFMKRALETGHIKVVTKPK